MDSDVRLVSSVIPNGIHDKKWINTIIAGSVSGIVADSLLHPFDTISLRMKVQIKNRPKYGTFFHACRTIVKEEGYRGVFSGLGTTLLFAPITTAIYFTAYETAKSVLEKRVPENFHPITHFAAGAFSELASSVLTVPTEVIKCRLQLGKNPHNASGGWILHHKNYRHTFHAWSSIFRSEGMKGLYAGYRACITVDMMFSAFAFAFYEQFKKSYSLLLEDKRNLNSAELLALGGFAGGFSALVTNPLDIICIRLMIQGKNRRYTSITQCLKSIIEVEGVSRLWKGAHARMLNVVPATGIGFAVYEGMKRLLFNNQLDDMDID